MGFCAKIEFDAYLISSIIELTCVQGSEFATKPLSSRLFIHSTELQRPTSGLWLAADRHCSVMASGRAGSN